MSIEKLQQNRLNLQKSSDRLQQILSEMNYFSTLKLSKVTLISVISTLKLSKVTLQPTVSHRGPLPSFNSNRSKRLDTDKIGTIPIALPSKTELKSDRHPFAPYHKLNPCTNQIQKNLSSSLPACIVLEVP